MSLSERISRGIKATFLARVLKIGAEAALVVVLARFLLSPEEYGLLFLALNVVGMVAILGSLGLPASGARYVTEYAERDPGQVPHVLRITLAYLLGLAVVVGLALGLFHARVASVLDEPDVAPLLLVGVLYVLFYAVTQYLVNVFQGFNRVSLSAAVNSVVAVGRAVFAVGFVLLGMGVLGAMIGYVVAYVVAAGVGLVVLYGRLLPSYDAAAEREQGMGRRILEYSVPLTATRGAAMLDKQVDTVLVGVFLNTVAVSHYTVAKQVSEMAIAVASSVGFTISPAVGKEKAGANPERAARLYETAFENTLLLYVPAAVGIVLVAEPLVLHVFGEGYEGAVVVLQVMSGFVMVNAVTQITSDGLDYLGRARDRAIVKSAMAVSNVLLNVALIPTIGVVGAAISTVITHTVYAAANVYIMSRELPLEFTGLGRSALTIGAVTGAMAVVVAAALPFVSGVPSLLAVVGLGVAIWGTLSVLGGLIEPRRVASFFR